MFGKRGKFIVMEGHECTGKSTIAPVLVQHLKDRGYKVIHTREPGGSPLAEKFRELTLSHDYKISGLTELFSMMTARSDHIDSTIIPALNTGHIVICERFVDSSFAYQGHGRGLMQQMLAMEEMLLAAHSTEDYTFGPDVTLFFDIPFEEFKRRLALRKGAADRIEKEGPEFYNRVYNGYEERYKQRAANPNEHIVRIDALPDPDTVLASVLCWANNTFENLA